MSYHIHRRDYDAVIEEIKKILIKFYDDLELAIIFGSLGRYESLPQSDIDLLLVGSQELKRQIKSDLANYTSMTGRQIDLVYFTLKSFKENRQLQVVRDALEEGVILWKQIDLID